jgi:hypothetical protein
MDYFILFSLLTAIFITSFVILKILRSKADYKRTLNLAFLKITLPKKNSDLDEKKETTKDFKEMIGLMEQLFSSLKSIYSRKILRKILGQDLLSFEYVAHE